MKTELIEETIKRVIKTLNQYHMGKNPEAVSAMDKVLFNIFTNTADGYLLEKASNIKIYSKIYFSNRSNNHEAREIILQECDNINSYLNNNKGLPHSNPSK